MNDRQSVHNEAIRQSLGFSGQDFGVCSVHTSGRRYQNNFNTLRGARSYTEDCYLWAIAENGAIIEESQSPYTDYPGGEDQYHADVETLQAAGVLADKATAGEWRMMGSGKDVYAFASGGDIIAQIGKDTYPKTRSAYMEYGNETDLALMVNAAEVARTLARFMPYVLAKLGDVK